MDTDRHRCPDTLDAIARVVRERFKGPDCPAVYLDVSGSVHDDLPRILGVLGNMQSDIEKVFTFSNDIVETSLKALAKGEGIRTTLWNRLRLRCGLDPGARLSQGGRDNRWLRGHD